MGASHVACLGFASSLLLSDGAAHGPCSLFCGNDGDDIALVLHWGRGQ